MEEAAHRKNKDGRVFSTSGMEQVTRKLLVFELLAGMLIPFQQ